MAIQAYPWQVSFQMPISPFMDKLDHLHSFIMEFLIAIVTFVLVWLFFLLFRFTYKIKSVEAPFPRIIQIQHNSFLEFIWTVVPFLILLAIFSSSAALIYDGANKTNISETFKVIGNQWYWKYAYSFISDKSSMNNNFASTENLFGNAEFDSYMEKHHLSSSPFRLNIYEDRPYSDEDRIFDQNRLLLTDYQICVRARRWVRFLISSSDVIHSWAVPVMGIKCDAVPGRINEVISLAALSGQYFGQCSELCGVNHGFMPINIWVYETI